MRDDLLFMPFFVPLDLFQMFLLWSFQDSTFFLCEDVFDGHDTFWNVINVSSATVQANFVMV